jgi:hypothetical protein
MTVEKCPHRTYTDETKKQVVQLNNNRKRNTHCKMNNSILKVHKTAKLSAKIFMHESSMKYC